MNEFCAESLVDITSWLNAFAFKAAFPNIEKIAFMQCISHDQQFSKFVPKLRYLQYQKDDMMSALNHFPNLKHLKIDSIHMTKKCMTTASTALYLNPNLKGVNIHLENLDFLVGVSDHLKCVKNLNIHIIYDRFLNAPAVHLSSVKQFALTFTNTYLGSEQFQSIMPNISISFDEIKEFILDGHFHNFDSFYIFINANPSIEMIIIKNKYMFRMLSPTHIQNALPHLKEIAFPFNTIAMDGILRYFEIIKSLKRLRVYCSNSDDTIKSHCGDKFKVSKCFNCKKVFFTFERIQH